MTLMYYKPETLSRFVKTYRSVDKLEPTSNMFSGGAVSTEQTYCEGAIGLNGPMKDYKVLPCYKQGEFNGKILNRDR